MRHGATIAAITPPEIRLRKSASLAALASLEEGMDTKKRRKRRGQGKKRCTHGGTGEGEGGGGGGGGRSTKSEREDDEGESWREEGTKEGTRGIERRERGIRMTAGTKQSAPLTSPFPRAMPASRDCRLAT